MAATLSPEDFFAGAEHAPFQLGSGPRRAYLIHGFMGTPAEMRTVGERLAAAGWSVTCDLLPGFGREVHRLGEMTEADWISATERGWHATRIGAEETLLVGFSMGGALALRLAAAAPPTRLVLMAPFTELPTPLAHLIPVARHVVPSFAPFANADFSKPDVRAQFATFGPSVDLDDPEIQAAIREQVQLPSRVLYALYRVGQAVARYAAHVTVPTLILQGRDDVTVLPALTAALVKRLNGPVIYHEFRGGHDFVKPDVHLEFDYARVVCDFANSPALPTHGLTA